MSARLTHAIALAAGALLGGTAIVIRGSIQGGSSGDKSPVDSSTTYGIKRLSVGIGEAVDGNSVSELAKKQLDLFDGKFSQSLVAGTCGRQTPAHASPTLPRPSCIFAAAEERALREKSIDADVKKAMADVKKAMAEKEASIAIATLHKEEVVTLAVQQKEASIAIAVQQKEASIAIAVQQKEQSITWTVGGVALAVVAGLAYVLRDAIRK